MSNYDSLQLTLSRQTGSGCSTSSPTHTARPGTLGDEFSNIDPYDPSRTYGVLNDGSHARHERLLERVPAGRRQGRHGQRDRPGHAEWLAGVGHLVAGQRDPHPPQLHGSGGERQRRHRLLRHGGCRRTERNSAGNGLAPVYSCDPRLGGTSVGEKLFDLNCISVPAFGSNGSLVPPYDLRTPTRYNQDLTLFKNFAIKGDQKIQFRVGFFNLFNNAFATTTVSASDINLTLDTVCNVTVNHVPDGTGNFQDNVCDPTKGFSLHAADEGQLRQDQPASWSPRRRAGAEVLLLVPD